MALTTAFENITIKHTLVKTLFFQRVFGIRAGFCSRSCRCSQTMNTGTRTTLINSNAILTGFSMLEISFVNALYDVSCRINDIQKTCTYARIYENRPRATHAIIAPFQSISVLSVAKFDNVSVTSSDGNAHILTIKSTRVTAPQR